jgi:hypothetical protein
VKSAEDTGARSRVIALPKLDRSPDRGLKGAVLVRLTKETALIFVQLIPHDKEARNRG